MLTSFVILCVDDDPAALKVRALVLRHAGYEVLTAADVEGALGIFRRNSVDLVIIEPTAFDIPVAEVIGRMKKIHPKVPIILLSGQIDLPSGSEEADLFLPMGSSTLDFLAAVDAMITHRRTSGGEGERR